jgi:hypothetical protein
MPCLLLDMLDLDGGHCGAMHLHVKKQLCLQAHLKTKESIEAYGNRGLQGQLSSTFVEVCRDFAPLAPLASAPALYRQTSIEQH